MEDQVLVEGVVPVAAVLVERAAPVAAVLPVGDPPKRLAVTRPSLASFRNPRRTMRKASQIE